MSSVPPFAFFGPHDLTDEVALTVEQDLRDGLPVFEDMFVKKGWITRAEADEGYIKGVFRGDRVRIAGPAAIRVITTDNEAEWQATRVIDDTYNFNIDCLAKVGNQTDEIERFINTFGLLVRNYLRRFSNLQPAIDGTTGPIRAYNSWPGKVVTGYAQGGVYRVARIPYWIRVMNPVVFRPIGPGC